MRALKLGRPGLVRNGGLKSQTAGSMPRVTSPLSLCRRSRTIGTTSVGAIEYCGIQSR